MKSPTIIKEGPHRQFDDLEFWAEDGVVCIMDLLDGSCNAVPCREFAFRAKAINQEAKRAELPSDKKRLQDCVLNMHETWKEAKEQGDLTDPEILKQKLKERRRAIVTPGLCSYKW